MHAITIYECNSLFIVFSRTNVILITRHQNLCKRHTQKVLVLHETSPDWEHRESRQLKRYICSGKTILIL